jgi:hypothetical protein
MPKTLKPILNWLGNPITGDRLGVLRNKFEEKQEERTEFEASRYEKLKNLILSFGGDEVLIPDIEEDIENLLHRGYDFDGIVGMEPGKPCDCHRNSCDLWEANREDFPHRLHINTGYGLSLDKDNIGVWRQHSWLYDSQEDSVIETTTQRDIYFGYQMTNGEASVFVENNL